MHLKVFSVLWFTTTKFHWNCTRHHQPEKGGGVRTRRKTHPLPPPCALMKRVNGGQTQLLSDEKWGNFFKRKNFFHHYPTPPTLFSSIGSIFLINCFLWYNHQMELFVNDWTFTTHWDFMLVALNNSSKHGTNKRLEVGEILFRTQVNFTSSGNKKSPFNF